MRQPIKEYKVIRKYGNVRTSSCLIVPTHPRAKMKDGKKSHDRYERGEGPARVTPPMQITKDKLVQNRGDAVLVFSIHLSRLRWLRRKSVSPAHKGYGKQHHQPQQQQQRTQKSKTPK